MTRNELLKLLCAAEGGKRQALDWPQSKETYSKLRKIIGENFGVDLDDIIREKQFAIIHESRFPFTLIAYRYLPVSSDGVHILPKRARKPASRKPARKRG